MWEISLLSIVLKAWFYRSVSLCITAHYTQLYTQSGRSSWLLRCAYNVGNASRTRTMMSGSLKRSRAHELIEATVFFCMMGSETSYFFIFFWRSTIWNSLQINWCIFYVSMFVYWSTKPSCCWYWSGFRIGLSNLCQMFYIPAMMYDPGAYRVGVPSFDVYSCWKWQSTSSKSF